MRAAIKDPALVAETRVQRAYGMSIAVQRVRSRRRRGVRRRSTWPFDPDLGIIPMLTGSTGLALAAAGENARWLHDNNNGNGSYCEGQDNEVCTTTLQ